MRLRVNHIVLVAKLSILLTASILAGALLIGRGAYATNTDINLAVSGSTAPNLELTSISSPVTVSTMPLVVSGIVDNLTQIQVYVDGSYSSTVPLTPSATTFSYSLNLNSGTHSVEFVGISAYTSTNPSVTIVITYTPPVVPSPGGEGTGTISPGAGGVLVGGESLPQLGTPSLLSISVPKWFYDTLVFFDIVNPHKVNDTLVTLWRLMFILIGLFLAAFAPLALAFYRWMRYRILHWDKHPLGRVLRGRPLFWIRLLGIILIIIVFVLF